MASISFGINLDTAARDMYFGEEPAILRGEGFDMGICARRVLPDKLSLCLSLRGRWR